MVAEMGSEGSVLRLQVELGDEQGQEILSELMSRTVDRVQ